MKHLKEVAQVRFALLVVMVLALYVNTLNMKRLIKKLNESVKLTIENKNRNLVAAICLMEFDRLIKFAEYSEDFLLLKRYIETLRYHLQSPIPMKLNFCDLPCHDITEEMSKCDKKFLLYEDL